VVLTAFQGTGTVSLLKEVGSTLTQMRLQRFFCDKPHTAIDKAKPSFPLWQLPLDLYPDIFTKEVMAEFGLNMDIKTAIEIAKASGIYQDSGKNRGLGRFFNEAPIGGKEAQTTGIASFLPQVLVSNVKSLWKLATMSTATNNNAQTAVTVPVQSSEAKAKASHTKLWQELLQSEVKAMTK
jgi:hypothetical protein